MTEPPPQHEIAEAIRELARQVDTLGNAVMSAARDTCQGHQNLGGCIATRRGGASESPYRGLQVGAAGNPSGVRGPGITPGLLPFERVLVTPTVQHSYYCRIETGSPPVGPG